jgi:hypothetical protein
MSAIGELCSLTASNKGSLPPKHKDETRHEKGMACHLCINYNPVQNCATLIRNRGLRANKKQETVCLKNPMILVGIHVHLDDNDKWMKNGKGIAQSRSTAAIESYSTMTFGRR